MDEGLNCDHDDLHSITFGYGADKIVIFTRFVSEDHRNRFCKLARDGRLEPVVEINETLGIVPDWVVKFGLLPVFTIIYNVLHFKNPVKGL